MCEEDEKKEIDEVLPVQEKKEDGFLDVKKRKRKQKDLEEVLPEKEKKIYICKSLRSDVQCTFGDKCNYAHSAKELEPQNCSFGESCGRVKIANNIVKNVNPNNPCAYLHGSETTKNYLIRHKMNEQMELNNIENLTNDVITHDFAYTRLCMSVIDSTPCTRGSKCTYAHSPEQLRINPCTYGVSCFHVSSSNGEYMNNGKSDKTCMFLHPDETLSNYASRVFNTKKVSPSSSGFVTPKAKKTKTDAPPSTPKKANKKIDQKPKENVVTEMILDGDKILEEKIIVNVPAHMAMEMLEMILKSGKTNIELRTF